MINKDKVLKLLNETTNFGLLNLETLEENNIIWESKENNIYRFKDKLIAETALYIFIIKRTLQGTEYNNLLATCDKIASNLIPYVLNQRNKIIIHKNPQLCFTFSLLYICLKDYWCQDDEYSHLLKRISALDKFNIFERLPFRQLDIMWVYNVNRGKSINLNTFKNSIIKLGTHPIYMERSDAYAFTHSIMYLTDFGKNYNFIHQSKFKIDIYNVLCASINWYLFVKDYDILAEMLISYFYCNFEINERVLIALGTMIDHWENFSYLPGPNYKQKTYEGLEEHLKKPYYFQHLYHTCYVFGLCLSAYIKYSEQSQKQKASHLSFYSKKKRINLINRTLLNIKNYLKTHFNVEPFDYDLLKAHYTTENTIYILNKYLSDLDAPYEYIKAIDSSNVNCKEKGEIIFEVITTLSIIEYNLEMLVEILCLYITNENSILNNYTFQEAIDYLQIQQMQNGLIGTFFYNGENLETLKKESITYHNKLIYLFISIEMYKNR